MWRNEINILSRIVHLVGLSCKVVVVVVVVSFWCS